MSMSTLEKVAAELPVDLVLALKNAGLAKVASALTGVPVHDEYSVYHKIGAELFLRKIERGEIQRGVLAGRVAGVL